jgi:hypothetical protein
MLSLYGFLPPRTLKQAGCRGFLTVAGKSIFTWNFQREYRE